MVKSLEICVMYNEFLLRYVHICPGLCNLIIYVMYNQYGWMHDDVGMYQDVKQICTRIDCDISVT